MCSKEYLIKHNQPKKINQLVSHNFLSFKGFEKNFFKNQVSLEPTITTDSLAVLFQLVLENEGIAAMPSFICKEGFKMKINSSNSFLEVRNMKRSILFFLEKKIFPQELNYLLN